MKKFKFNLNIGKMKKVFLALAVLVMALSATSCNKQKKCQCTWKMGNVSYEGEVFLSEEGKSCEDYEATYNYSEIQCRRVY